MNDSIENIIVTAILGMTTKPTKVPDKIIKQSATINLLESSSDHLIDSSVIAQRRAHIVTLSDKQIAMKGGPVDRTNQRNIAFNVVIADRKKDMAIVQQAADDLHNPVAAEALILRNGFEVKKHAGPHSNPDISVVNKENEPGTLVATSKSPGKNVNFSIDWMYSADNGVTWIMWHSTPVVKTEIPGFTSGTKIIIRRRFIKGSNSPEGWVQSAPIIVL